MTGTYTTLDSRRYMRSLYMRARPTHSLHSLYTHHTRTSLSSRIQAKPFSLKEDQLLLSDLNKKKAGGGGIFGGSAPTPSKREEFMKERWVKSCVLCFEVLGVMPF
jgi:hypothetical protein